MASNAPFGGWSVFESGGWRWRQIFGRWSVFEGGGGRWRQIFGGRSVFEGGGRRLIQSLKVASLKYTATFTTSTKSPIAICIPRVNPSG